MVSSIRYVSFFLLSGSVVSAIFYGYALFIAWTYEKVMAMHFDDRDLPAVTSLLVVMGVCYFLRKPLIKGAEKIKWGLIQVSPAQRFGLYFMALVSIIAASYISYRIWKFNTWGMVDVEYFMDGTFTLLAIGLVWLLSFSSFDKLSQKIDLKSKQKTAISFREVFDTPTQ